MTTVLVRVAPVGPGRDEPRLGSGDRRRDEPHHRTRASLTADSLLRQLLAQHASVDPLTLSLQKRCRTCGASGHGKPGVFGRPDLHVSLSYAAGLAAAAFCAEAPIGVDVETVVAADFDGFDRVALAPEEANRISDLTGARLLHARCRLWTRKEALLKATGHGLTVDPTQIVVSGPDEPAALEHWPAAGAPVGTMQVVDVDLRRLGTPDELAATHHLAVAVVGGGLLRVRPG